MKKLTNIILTCGLLAVGLTNASAVATMRLSGDGGATWVVVVDNGPLDSSPTAGFIHYDGVVGNWYANLSTALGSPLLGTATQPSMDVGSSSLSQNPASLIVQMSDTDFVGSPNQTFVSTIAGQTDGTVTFNTYRDTGNVLFGTTELYPSDSVGVSPSPTASLLSSLGPITSANFANSNGVSVATGATPYSLTLETIIVHAGAGDTGIDAALEASAPQPCNCTVTFNSPQSITNCAGDTIPAVTATQDCGSGPVSIPVTFVGAVTNGSSPQIITRNYTATDNCGAVHTFVQTIRVNSNPDCTITPSVTTAMVGGSNYTASVASAGSGATYVWSVLNGTITAGQGTATITWSAGTDTNSPISIFITITAATGCQSSCSASVKLTPQPPKISLGGGDTATIGFWHNKNGQGLINNAPSSPVTLANWLATSFPCLYGNLAGKSNADVAALFMADFGVKGAKSDAQVLAGALACYFTSTSLGGGPGPVKFGFNQSPSGTSAKSFNVGSYGTILGLQNNTSYTVLQILQAASNAKCNPAVNQSALANALNTIFDGINSTGDIS